MDFDEKTHKRIIALLLCLVLMLSISMPALAADFVPQTQTPQFTVIYNKSFNVPQSCNVKCVVGGALVDDPTNTSALDVYVDGVYKGSVPLGGTAGLVNLGRLSSGNHTLQFMTVSKTIAIYTVYTTDY